MAVLLLAYSSNRSDVHRSSMRLSVKIDSKDDALDRLSVKTDGDRESFGRTDRHTGGINVSSLAFPLRRKRRSERGSYRQRRSGYAGGHTGMDADSSNG